MVVSVSDEVVTLLILKNNYGVWAEMGSSLKNGHGKKTLEQCIEKQIYFNEGKGRGKSWNTEGKIYYNDMYKNLIEDCLTNGKEFDNKFLNWILDEKGGRRKRKYNNNLMADNIKCYADIDMSLRE